MRCCQIGRGDERGWVEGGLSLAVLVLGGFFPLPHLCEDLPFGLVKFSEWNRFGFDISLLPRLSVPLNCSFESSHALDMSFRMST